MQKKSENCFNLSTMKNAGDGVYYQSDNSYLLLCLRNVVLGVDHC